MDGDVLVQGGSRTAGIKPAVRWLAHLRAFVCAVRLDALLYLVVACVFVAASIPYAAKAGRDASAFIRWHNQIEEISSDEDIYLRHGYPNPPIMAVLLYPLVALPPLAGALAWYYLKAGMALICFT